MGRWLGLGDQARVSTAFLVAVLSILGILAVELASGTRMSTGTTAIEVLGFIAAAALLMARRH